MYKRMESREGECKSLKHTVYKIVIIFTVSLLYSNLYYEIRQKAVICSLKPAEDAAVLLAKVMVNFSKLDNLG